MGVSCRPCKVLLSLSKIPHKLVCKAGLNDATYEWRGVVTLCTRLGKVWQGGGGPGPGCIEVPQWGGGKGQGDGGGRGSEGGFQNTTGL